ncbi:hypothetical protein N431DRAFT_322744 [Stipitochalara longipes BDJ]|nr:hypothetical protein N431DRAFT_322744 [Stipitochalara longipes BDJ]
MYLDTTYNSTTTVLTNIYTAFLETATKMWTYARCLPPGKQPGTKLLIKTITDLVEMAYVLIKSKGRGKKGLELGYKCAVTKPQIEFMALTAFRNVLKKRQTKYGKAIAWLDEGILALKLKDSEALSRMRGIVSSNAV